MKATKDHISFETAKLLKDCGIKNKYVMRDNYPAFTWQEILWEHAEKFFGSETIHINGMDTGFGDYLEKPREILKLLQKKKYDKADEYFRKHCILINNK